MKQKQHNGLPKFTKLLPALLVILVLYAVLPQLGVFRQGLSKLPDADAQQVTYAVLSVCATFLLATTTYCILSLKRLPCGRTLVAMLAGMFADRLLPAGIGGIGIGYAYLRRQGQTTARAASVVAINNILGFVGHVLLIITFLVILRPEVHLSSINMPVLDWRVALVVMALAGLFAVTRHFWSRIRKGLVAILKQILVYKTHPIRLSLALVSSMGLTVCNVLCLYFCCQALGVEIDLMQVLLVFSFGILLGTATPTPGGLGGVEAGLFAGLIAYDVPTANAFAAVLVFRLVSYWLPLIVGGLTFVYASRANYFKFR